MLDAMIAHHRAGRLQEAEAGYRTVLRRAPANSDAHHLLGLLCLQQGRLEEAERSVRQAIRLNPTAAFLSSLGTILKDQGRLAEAADTLREAVAVDESQAQTHYNLANTLKALGRLDEAVAAYRRALALRPAYANAAFNLGNTLLALRRPDEALDAYEVALGARPDYPECLQEKANALSALGRLEDADAAIDRALSLRPGWPEGLYTLGCIRQKQERDADACDAYAQALANRPTLFEARINLGHTLQRLGRLDEAVAAAQSATALRPDDPAGYCNLGIALKELNRLDEALAAFRHGLQVAPEHARTHFNAALTALLAGDFSTGWSEYRWRWRESVIDTPWRPFPQPVWQGEHPDNRFLLIWGEQGIGDEIMFGSLLPALSDGAGTGLILECTPKLAPLFRRSLPKAIIVPRLDPPPDTLTSDPQIAWHAPIGDLARHLRPDTDSFGRGSPGWLRPDREQTRTLHARLGADGPRVGLAWRSTNTTSGAQRSLPLRTLLAALASIPASFVALQYDADEAEYRDATAATGVPLHGLPGLNPFDDIDGVAAFMAGLDAVVSIDNSTVHLAGGLGVPTWLLLPHHPDWRWLLTPSHSLWWRSLTLLRQDHPGVWDAPLAQAAEALRAHLAGTGRAPR